MKTIVRSTIFALAAAAMGPVPAFAKSKPWQMGFPDPASPLAEDMMFFHNDILVPITVVISVFVLLLLLYTCWRFSEKRNPTPSKTTHNSLLEVVWTLVPILILIGIAVPSFKILYETDKVADADMTLKITGHQWYWSYEYPDNGDFTFDANMIATEDLQPGQKRLMDTDNIVYLPTNTKVRILVTSTDVIHNWSVSEFGVRIDSVPGRLNEAWVSIDKPGMYYGFCSELCGTNHSFMPIAVKAVSPEEFKAWVEKAKEKYASVDGGKPATRAVASNTAVPAGEPIRLAQASE